MGKKKYTDIPYSDDLIEGVLYLLKANPNLNTQQIANITRRPYTTISRLRRYLKKKGLLPQVPKTNNQKKSESEALPETNNQKKPLTLKERVILAKKKGVL